ncbi:meckelin [Takifugu flavidus]|uniref:meckelin n=1 Tax=Takifugu flavidus TaxID=433684 RepID=UPI002544044E|nr:meckelin [Takifugu flavidus]
MATETLGFITRWRESTLFLLLCIDFLSGQQFILPHKAPLDCGSDEFFDISSLSCVKCGPNQQRSTTGLSCICTRGYQTLITEKVSISCQQCPLDKPAVTQEGSGCIRCPGSIGDDGRCQCPTGSILVERNVNGNLLDEARCELCNENSPTFSVPNSNGDRCVRCHPTYRTDSCACNPPNIAAGGLCFPPNSLSTNVNPSVSYNQLKFSIQSAWFVKNLYSSAAACLLFSNLTACQALGNMCVMNMHSFSSMSVDACGLFNTIFRAKAALSSTQDISYWRSNLPWLYYGEEPGLAIRVLQTEPVPIRFSFRGKNKNTDFNLLAAVYNVRGDFLRWEQLGLNNLQLCGETATRQAAAFSFGTAYQQSCDLSVAELMSTYSEPLFYDVFMDLGGEEERKLFPLPTLVNNLQYNGQFINQESMKSWYLSRRLFLVDMLSGREKSTSSVPKVIRVATSIKIRFELVPDSKEGTVFPPLMSITYSDIPITDVSTQTVSATFAVQYEMNLNEFHIIMDIVLGVLGSLFLLNTLLRTIRWKRRFGSQIIDGETLMKFLLFAIGDLSNVFFFVTVGTAVYWLIFYKAQQTVTVVLPLPAQEERYKIFIGLAFAGKAVQFLQELRLQVTVDLFFIDWERPRCSGGLWKEKPAPGTGEPKSDSPPVSIWRTYFVANEWNKIQTLRQISPTFQIIAVLFFLEVLGFSNYALSEPVSTAERSPQAFTPPYSMTLRYGLASILWLCLGLLQVIYFTLYERFVKNNIHQFVDLCSISNISVLLFSHPCFGYYIHGHSVHGHADTNMEEMSNNLKREAESMCGQRGLLPNTEVQTFQVSFTRYLRTQYERIQDLSNRRTGPLRSRDSSSANQFEQNTSVYNTMNHFLGSFIDHAYSEMDYIVKDKQLFETLLGVEPGEKSIFYNDEDFSFKDVLFYGNEATLLIFDTLFFCVVDLGAQSFVLAAVLTYVEQTIFSMIRQSLGRRNLINKTLVDNRFLI